MALLLLSLMLLLAVGASLGEFQFCPPREDLLPCTCTVNEETSEIYHQVKVFCWKVDDVDDLRRALQSLKFRMVMVSLEIKDSRLGTVPSDLFDGIAVSEVTFDNCVLKRIGNVGRLAVEGEGVEETLQKLAVKGSFSKNNPLTFLNVSGIKTLKILDIPLNKMKELGNEWFAKGPENLEVLKISVNEISKLGDRAFSLLTKLKDLRMGFNEIATLKRSMFPSPAVYLEDIFIHSNKITSLPADLFSNMPKLIYVNLFNNSIQHIPEETWKPVWSDLQYLFLEENPLNCDADIDWILKVSRPRFLTGKCSSPYKRRGMDLTQIIDDKQRSKY